MIDITGSTPTLVWSTPVRQVNNREFTGIVQTHNLQCFASEDEAKDKLAFMIMADRAVQFNADKEAKPFLLPLAAARLLWCVRRWVGKGKPISFYDEVWAELAKGYIYLAHEWSSFKFNRGTRIGKHAILDMQCNPHRIWEHYRVVPCGDKWNDSTEATKGMALLMYAGDDR
jgi:hypothetical protein